MYSVKLHHAVEKAFRKLEKSDRSYAERIEETVLSLAQDPRPHGYKKLSEDLFRIRVGSYRIVYAIFEKIVTVVVVRLTTRGEQTYSDLRKLRNRAAHLVED